METSEGFEMTAYIPDVRQSPKWGKFLSIYGWEMPFTSGGIGISLRRSKLGALVKVQRPRIFSKKDLEEIEKICVDKKALFIKIEPLVGQDLKLLDDAGYVLSRFPQCPPKTMYIHLEKSEEELWKRVSKNARYSLNRAKKEGASVEFYAKPSEELLKKYHALSTDTAQFKKFYALPYADFKAYADAFGDGCFIFFVKDNTGEIVGAKFFVAEKGMVLFVSGATTQKGRRQRSGYTLMWESILQLKKLGYKILDLEGLDDERFPHYTSNWGGFSHFKEKFGGEVITFPVPRIKYLNPILATLSKWAPFSL